MTKKAHILAQREFHRRHVGFSPVTNLRLAQAVKLAYAAQLELGHAPARAMAEAERVVARSLAPTPFRRSYRLSKPSRSDDPAYRKPMRARGMLISCARAA